MDTSEKYIEMCRKAEEIQELFKGAKGDFYAWQAKKNSPLMPGVFGGGLCGDLDQEDLLLIKEELIWLPRQDQLQEMLIGLESRITRESLEVSCIFKNARSILLGFWEFYTDEFGVKNKYYANGIFPLNKENGPFDSLEQLWLAFVMREKYDKIRDGGNWIKCNK